MSSANAFRAAVYVRISRDDDEERYGVERQRKDCLDRVRREGWAVVNDGASDTFTDNDVSGGGATGREAYGRLVAAVQAGRVDAVVAYSQARLARNAMLFLEFCEI